MRRGLKVVGLTLLVLLSACHRGRGTPISGPSVSAGTATATATAVPPPTPPAIPAPGARALDAARRELAARDYVASARDFEEYLVQVPAGGERDAALFSLGVIYAQQGARPDWPRASASFSRLAAEFPSSPLAPAAQLILSLRNELGRMSTETDQRDQRIRQLTTELERLIRIDSERRGR